MIRFVFTSLWKINSEAHQNCLNEISFSCSQIISVFRLFRFLFFTYKWILASSDPIIRILFIEELLQLRRELFWEQLQQSYLYCLKTDKSCRSRKPTVGGMKTLKTTKYFSIKENKENLRSNHLRHFHQLAFMSWRNYSSRNLRIHHTSCFSMFLEKTFVGLFLSKS